MYSSCKIWKKSIDNASFFVFHIGPNLAQMLPLRPHPLSFFVDFHLYMLGDSININNFCSNPVVLKKIGITSKYCSLCLSWLKCCLRNYLFGPFGVKMWVQVGSKMAKKRLFSHQPPYYQLSFPCNKGLKGKISCFSHFFLFNPSEAEMF